MFGLGAKSFGLMGESAVTGEIGWRLIRPKSLVWRRSQSRAVQTGAYRHIDGELIDGQGAP